MAVARSAIALAVCLITATCGREPTVSEGDRVRERWHQPQPGVSWARPVVVGDLVYFGTGDGRVIARDTRTGAQRWATRVGIEGVMGANFVARDGVVAVTLIRHTVGLDATTGRELWRYEAPADTGIGAPDGPGGVMQARLDADDHVVYVPAWGASVSAVELRTGALRWVWQPGRAPTDTNATSLFRSGAEGVRVSGDTVFATVWHNLIPTGGRSESWLVALDRATGRELWRVTLPVEAQAMSVRGAPAIAGDRVLVAAGMRGEVFAVDRATQQVVWQHVTPERQHTALSQPAAYGDLVYADGGDSHLYALQAQNGAVVWRSPFPTQTAKDLLVTERRVVFSTGAYLYVLDRATGRRIVEITQPYTTDPLFASPATFADGAVFVGLSGAAWSFVEP